MGSLLGKAKIGIDESINNFLNTVESTLPKDQQITITEAALIKYFQPKYNFEYKTNFPDKIHASYEVCYRLDLNSVAFELDTVSIVSRLHSASIEPSHIHLHQYFLHNEKERKDMFKMI